VEKMKRKVAMCLMAHPDDCEILAAGTLALLQKVGWEVHIVTMTPGDAGSADLGPQEIASQRRGEGAKAAKVLGATYHCLESRDLYVMFDEPTLRRALSLTRALAPTLVITHSLVDYMLDHEETAKIARSATFGYMAPNVAAGAIPTGAMVPYLYYADPIEGMDVYGEPVRPTTYVDISSAMAAKTRALKAHASQREWLRKHHGIDQYIQAMQHWAAKRGREVEVKYAEGFRQHKGHSYPRDCILEHQLRGLVVQRG